MADPFDLYPRPPAQAQNALTDPTRAIGLLNAINANRLQQQEIFARDSASNVYKGAFDEDGKINPLKLNQRINEGAGGYLAPQLFSTVQSQEQQRVATDTAKIQQSEMSRGIVNSIVGSLDPKMTPQQARAAIIKQSTMFPPGILLSQHLNGAIRDIDKIGLPAYIANATRQATGAPALAAPDVDVVQPSGATTKYTRGQSIDANTPPSAPVAPGAPRAPGLPTTLPTGQQGAMETAAKQSANLVATVDSSAQTSADLSNIKQYSKILKDFGGPTADLELKVGALANRIGIKDGITLGKTEQAAAEGFKKLVEQLAGNQQRQMSDAGLSSAQAQNPSLMMSQWGREGVIDALRGNQDAINLARKEWLKSKLPAQDFPRWREKFNEDADVRVFQFNRMDKEAQQKFINGMGKEEADAFRQKFYATRDKGWLP